jgi:basic amino acid/polyamine antiporter, APA family
MKTGLRRELNLLTAVAVGLGAIIGAGIFVVTGVAAGVAGPAFLIGLFLAGIVATFNALSSAQLAATYPQSGGTYEYGHQVLRPWLGFAAGWMFLASKLAAGGTVALGFAGYFSALVPGVPLRLVALAAVIVLTIVNYFGIQKAGLLNIIIVLISVLSLVTVVLTGIPTFSQANLHPFAPTGLHGILQSAALLFFAYTGYARLATLGEEVREPDKTIPRAIILALGTAIVLYLAVAVVTVGNIGAEGMVASSSPIEHATRVFRWPQVGRVVVVGAATAMLGVLLSQILGISRMVFAMARRRDLPEIFAHIHPIYAIPDLGIFLTAGIMVLVVIFGTLEVVLATASFTILLYYSIANLAAMNMRPEDRRYPRWISIFGLISCLILAGTLDLNVIISGIGLLIIGFLLRWLFHRLPGKSSVSL